MNPRKFGIILGSVIVVAIMLMLIGSAVSKDEVRPNLEKIINDGQTVIDLSNQASQQASVFEVQTQAATIATTTLSDNQQLRTFYKDRYGKDVKAPKSLGNQPGSSNVVEELKNGQRGAGYDTTYKDLVKERLQSNLEILQTLYDNSSSSEFKTIIEAVYDNQKQALEAVGS